MDDDKIVPFKLPEGWDSLGNLYRSRFEIDSGALRMDGRPTHAFIWLYANSDDSAGRKAYKIIKQLPYSLASPNPLVCPCPELLLDSNSPEFNDLIRQHEQIARQCGLSFMLVTYSGSEME